MPNEALKKLFSVRPPTIEEILSQQNAHETSSASTLPAPTVTGSKRKIPSVPLIQGTLCSSTFNGQENLVMHVTKKTRATSNPKPTSPPSHLHKRKESECSTDVEQQQPTPKKLKPSSLRSGSTSPKFERKIVDSNTHISSNPTITTALTEPQVPQASPVPRAPSAPLAPLPLAPPVPPALASVAPDTVPNIASSAISTQSVHGSAELKASNQESKTSAKKRQKRNKLAKRAAKKHHDYPKETKELDFDTLLKYHEEASKTANKKQDQPTCKKEKTINKAPLNPKATIRALINSSGPSKAAPPLAENVFTVAKHQQNHISKASKCIPPTKKEVIKSNKVPGNKSNKNQKKFVPTVVCNYFLKGFCKQGDACTFKHEGEPAPPPTLNTVCQFFKTGSCNQGTECKFSHDLKLEPCRFYHMQGSCEQEDHCPYSHEPLNEDRLNRLRALTGPCRFYHFKGYCNSGDACLFSHAEASDDEKKVVESNILACRFFHITKNCKQGDDCFYLHDEASAEQIRKLE